MCVNDCAFSRWIYCGSQVRPNNFGFHSLRPYAIESRKQLREIYARSRLNRSAGHIGTFEGHSTLNNWSLSNTWKFFRPRNDHLLISICPKSVRFDLPLAFGRTLNKENATNQKLRVRPSHRTKTESTAQNKCFRNASYAKWNFYKLFSDVVASNENACRCRRCAAATALKSTGRRNNELNTLQLSRYTSSIKFVESRCENFHAKSKSLCAVRTLDWINLLLRSIVIFVCNELSICKVSRRLRQFSQGNMLRFQDVFSLSLEMHRIMLCGKLSLYRMANQNHVVAAVCIVSCSTEKLQTRKLSKKIKIETMRQIEINGCKVRLLRGSVFGYASCGISLRLCRFIFCERLHSVVHQFLPTNCYRCFVLD